MKTTGIKEAIQIRREKTTLNANVDEERYNLSQIWMNTIKSQSK